MTSSILEQKYKEQTRPYSQRELNNIRDTVFRQLRVGSTQAYHKECEHCYRAKHNGKKEREIIETKCPDVGNCSVCWKIRKTPPYLKSTAKNLIDAYRRNFYPDSPTYMTYDLVDIETTFYKWLYEEMVR